MIFLQADPSHARDLSQALELIQGDGATRLGLRRGIALPADPDLEPLRPDALSPAVNEGIFGTQVWHGGRYRLFIRAETMLQAHQCTLEIELTLSRQAARDLNPARHVLQQANQAWRGQKCKLASGPGHQRQIARILDDVAET